MNFLRPPLRIARRLARPVKAWILRLNDRRPKLGLLSRRGRPLPAPDPSLHPVGDASADEVGPVQLGLLKHFGLNPDDRILDLGCGIGRLTYKIVHHVTEGEYHGLDISKKAIDWLNRHYASVLPHFHFTLLDIQNERYNRKGSLDPKRIRLPYPDSFFDVVCAFSVFTHMLPEESAHYLKEIRRILKPDAWALLTFFSIDPTVDVRPCYGSKPFLPLPNVGDVWTLSTELPERGIAVARNSIEKMVEDAGLSIEQFVSGYWRTDEKPTAPPSMWAHQDVYVLTPTPV